jgi:hypothetical protein
MLIQSLGTMRSQLDDLQRQLGTGQLSTTYAGLGANRGLAVNLQSQLASMSAYSDTMTMVGVRIDMQQTALSRFTDLQHTVGSETQASFDPDTTGKTTAQRSASAQLDEMIGLLNTKVGDRYLFSGRATNTPATPPSSLIMNGDATHAGFLQIVSERKQADLGANGLGRLVIPAVTSSAASMTGTTAALSADAPAVATGSADLSIPYTSAGGMLTINGTNVTIPAGADVNAVMAAINGAGTGVTATAPGGQLTLTGPDADTAIDLTGTTGSLLTEFGMSAGPAQPTNLLTQGAVSQGQTLTVTVGSNPPLTVTFGTNQSAVPPEVSTLAELNAALGTLTGGTASVNTANGNISITSANTTDPITIGGTANAANFGLTGTSAPPSNVVSLSEEAASSPFGFKLAGVTTTSAGATVSGPTGSPASVSVNLQAQPNPGDSVTFSFNLPDGSTEQLALTATTASPPGTGQFTIGANLAATSANLQTALNSGVSTLAQTSLTAASAIAAGHNFFDIDAGQPPMRVAGPPFTSATALTAGTSSNTVMWYTGEMGTDPARGTAVVQVDDSLTVSYGVRGNEQAFRNAIMQTAVFAAMDYPTSDPNAQARSQSVGDRLYAGLTDNTTGQQRVQDIGTELAYAQTTMQSAKTRQATKQTTLQNLLGNIEQAPQDQVASEILALQTRLQAALQTTATLYKLSIINYL